MSIRDRLIPSNPPASPVPVEWRDPALHPAEPNTYQATPESIALARQHAAEERATMDAEIRACLRMRAKATLATLIGAHGALLIRTLLEELEAEQ
jgi:hypothetical protein